MPIYEYECTSCGYRFELRRSIADNDSEIKCPQCEVEYPRRIISVFATASNGDACAPSGPT